MSLRRLYSSRIKSDYDAENIGSNHAEQLIQTVKEVIEIIREISNGSD
ncbi:MAG: HEPN domain-containing protein [Desulfobacterales bacterium]|nr:HEPN domain-containing protein [Desulfobacterales bacterium]